MIETRHLMPMRRYKTRGAVHHQLTRANKALAASLEVSNRGFLVEIARETACASIRANPRRTRYNAAILYNRAFRASLSSLMKPVSLDAVEYENCLVPASL